MTEMAGKRDRVFHGQLLFKKEIIWLHAFATVDVLSKISTKGHICLHIPSSIF